MNQKQKLLNSLSTLTVIFENDHKDYIELFLPFVKDILVEKKYSAINPHDIVDDFMEIHGLPIPYHAVCSILTRCKKRKMIFVRDKQHYAVKDLSKFESLSDFNSDNSKLVNELHDFLIESLDPQIALDTTYEMLLGFLDDYSYQILISYKNRTKLSDIKLKKKEKSIIGHFIDEQIEKDNENLEELLSLTISSLIVNIIAFENVGEFLGKLTKVKIFIDTPIILKYIGVEGDAKRKAFTELFKMIRNHGGEICIFKHTYEETMQILKDCQNYINNPDYDPKLASPALKYFIANNYSSTKLSIFISKVTTILRTEGIKYDIEVDPDQYKDYQIDENKLYDYIKASYKTHNYVYEDWKKRNVILRDVKSISNIYRLRKGDNPVSLAGSKNIFLTTNSNLAFACFDFEAEVFDDYNTHACFTDVFLGTLLWLQNPSELEKISKLSLISKCKEYLDPDEKLIELFLEKIEELKNDDIISDNEYYFLRTHKLAINILNEKMHGDPDEFYDKSPEEILEEIKESAKGEVIEKYQPMIDENADLKGDLIDTNKELDTISSNLDNFIKIISSLLSWSVFTILLVAVVLSFIFSFRIPNHLWLLKLIVQGISGIIGILNVLLGVNLVGIRNKMCDCFYKKIKKKINGA